MNITTARKVAKTPSAFTEAELHEALDVVVSDERFTEVQVVKAQAAIELELNHRKGVYPIGTNVNDIKNFDRGIKVHVRCLFHPEVQYMTKQWGVSNVFPANEHTKRAEFGIDEMECDHKFRDDVWVTASVYYSTNHEA